MSTETERIEEGAEASLLERWDEWYHIPVIGVVMLFMFLVRIQAYDNFAMRDGSPSLAAVDSWYHWRTIEWTAENYPSTMPYEIWTSFPDGRYVGQFGTLFDQLIVTAAMIVGLGDPSTETLYAVALIAVPVMAALVAIPVFYIGRRLGGTLGGIVAVVLLALAPGQFLQRSTTGQLQHHVAEVLFMAIAILAFMIALRVAEREQPIYELVVDKDWDTLKQPAIYSALAGIALSLYIWVWPPGVVLIGIFAAYFTVQLCLDYVRGVSPDHVAFVGVVGLGVTALVTALLIEEPGTSVTSFGYLQPVSAALVAVGCAFMAWFARQWNAYDADRRYYPVAIAGLIVAVFGAMAVVLPDLYSTIVGNLTSRLLPLDPGTGALTIQEAQPPADFTAHVFDEFGTAFYTMLAGLGLLVARPFLGREFRAEHTLIVVWSLFLISMAATQIRFAYYLVLAVAVVNAIFVADVVRFFDLDIRSGVDSIRQLEGYQVIVLLMVVLLLFAPLLPPVAAEDSTAWERGEMVGPHNEAMVWEDSNHWLNENTPEPGNWAGAGYEDELEYFGTYDIPDDGTYDYPEGSYGVMSWWDYGHLITVQGERIPHSNPFQSNARSSSAFLTAESEERSELILDAIAAGESPDDHTDEELEAMAEDADESHEHIRYVMIDDLMAGGKFNAIATWTGPDPAHYSTPEDVEANEQIERDEVADRFATVPYDNTTLSKLYFDDAVGMEHYRLVHENDQRMPTFVSYAIIDTDTDQVLLGEGGDPQVFVNRMVDEQTQMELMQLEQHPEFDVEVFDERQGSAVGTYERVEGATLTGSVDDVGDVEDATVSAALELETNTDREFTYVQEAELAEDGSFELTVPYATDDELGVEDGYTDSAVEALEEYTVSVVVPSDDGFEGYEAETEVPETAVVEGETVDVALEEVEFDDPDEVTEEGDVEDDDADLEDAEDGEVIEDGEETDETPIGEAQAGD
ncbi:oligosaccharyl transferase, archaeosortase A system-associated [Natrarchaeobaculum sulfurireducens]|uniref:dolichyl-phosphooligosaccharide-protein glycotransferase n=1 Tax=Natrarchaeobaculum sulfurireducens TaxID=2044521 RepID=A0A346PCF2_9EURY|nr:oligosaccharyl transferase, archaeosortase A system-associated [Natrarchaeobaculum sulfurireducens]AXR77197.1 Dolichol phosphate-mannose mannosyltransferase [Natrarchaeobaculum sulfurireducens]AXR82836.1 transmembrane oligosaccharyl transferase [Natrarchaeobaculum sulfurireducens]